MAFSSRKVAWEILESISVHSCSRSRPGGVHVSVGSMSSNWMIQCFHVMFHTEYGMKFLFSPLTLIQLSCFGKLAQSMARTTSI